MNNKTTVSGIIAGIGFISKGIYELTAGDYATGIADIIAGLGCFGVGLFAKDASNVTKP